MSTSFDALLSPLSVGSFTLKNRIVMTAHGEQFAHEGRVTEHQIRHYERRAEGGVGLIIAGGSSSVHPSAANPGMISLWDPENEAPLRDLARRVHAHGSVLLCQASHRATRESPMGIDPALVSPSPGPASSGFGAPAELDLDEITDIVENYGQAAERLHRCGFDGIQLTAMGSHLIEQFWSPLLNQRNDSYGGSLENRMRFGKEVLKRVAAGVPASFLISFRMSADACSDTLGLTTDDLLEIGVEMSRNPRIDMFDITGGSGLSVRAHSAAVPTEDAPEACYNHLSREYRARIPQPVSVAGRILDAELGEKTIAVGDADLVGMTRALIADPDLPKRLTEDRAASVRPCIAINEGCRRVVAGKTMACTVNPAVADASLDVLRPTDNPGHVIVIGGGPAGLEAARVAALRGNRVTLFERSQCLGGQVRLAARLGNRPHFERHLEWLQREIAGLDVEVRLGQDITSATLMQQVGPAPKAIVLATGARGFVPVEAAGLACQTGTEFDVLEGRLTVPSSARVLVYDAEGHHRGVHLALLAESEGARVDLVTPFTSAAANLEAPNKPAALSRLHDSLVNVLPDWQLAGSRDGRVLLRHAWTEGERQLGEYDIALFVGYRHSEGSLYKSLKQDFRTGEIHVIGDSKAPRLLRNAISEGVRAAVSL